MEREAIEGLVDRDGAAELLGVSAKTISRLHKCGLPFVRLPGSGTKPLVRYFPSTLMAWARERQTGEAAPTAAAGEAAAPTRPPRPNGTDAKAVPRVEYLEALDTRARAATLASRGTLRPVRKEATWGA